METLEKKRLFLFKSVLVVAWKDKSELYTNRIPIRKAVVIDVDENGALSSPPFPALTPRFLHPLLLSSTLSPSSPLIICRLLLSPPPLSLLSALLISMVTDYEDSFEVINMDTHHSHLFTAKNHAQKESWLDAIEGTKTLILALYLSISFLKCFIPLLSSFPLVQISLINRTSEEAFNFERLRLAHLYRARDVLLSNKRIFGLPLEIAIEKDLINSGESTNEVKKEPTPISPRKEKEKEKEKKDKEKEKEKEKEELPNKGLLRKTISRQNLKGLGKAVPIRAIKPPQLLFVAIEKVHLHLVSSLRLLLLTCVISCLGDG